MPTSHRPTPDLLPEIAENGGIKTGFIYVVNDAMPKRRSKTVIAIQFAGLACGLGMFALAVCVPLETAWGIFGMGLFLAVLYWRGLR